jgi:hypothetical protein
MEAEPLDPWAIGFMRRNLAMLRQTPMSVVLAALILLASIYVPRFKFKSQMARFPLILEHLSSEQRRAKFLAGAKALYKDGSQKVFQCKEIRFILLTRS